MLLSEEIQFLSLKVSFSLPCPSFLVWYFAYLSLEMSIKLFFFLFLFPGYFGSVDTCVVWIVSSGWNQSFFALFYVTFLSYQCINAILNSGSPLPLFSRLLHLWDVRPFASTWVFLFSGPFTEVLFSSTLRMVLSNLREGEPRYLSLWWDFCYVVWFRVVFSSSWATNFSLKAFPKHL